MTQEGLQSHGGLALGEVDHSTGADPEEMAVAEAGVEEFIGLGNHECHGERGSRFPDLRVESLLEDLPVGVTDCGECVAAPGRRRDTAALHPLGPRVSEQVLEDDLGGLEAPVSVRHRHQDARGADGEEDGVFVGIGVRVFLLCAPHGDGDGGRTLRHRVDRAEFQMLASAKERRSHLISAAPAALRGEPGAKRRTCVSRSRTSKRWSRPVMSMGVT